jgi:hypothetical protein
LYLPSLQILEQLKRDVMRIKAKYPDPTGTEIDTSQVLTLLAWDYTAREFLRENRFDLLLPRDRYSSLYHSLQSGV